MAKEIYMYGGINGWSAETFIQALEEAKDEEIVARVNSGGGSVFDGYGMITKMQEHTKNITIKVDGIAASMAFFMLPFADSVEANDVAQFMVHRADGYAETQEHKDLLSRINKSMQSKLESKLDLEAFEKISGTTLKAIFEAEEQTNVWLTAKQAKKVGLIDKVNVLSTADAEQYKSMVAMLNTRMEDLNAQAKDQKDPNKKSKLLNNHKFKTMTKAEFKKQNPDGYAEILADGSMLERERVNTALVFLDADANAVKEIIASGKAMSTTQMAELSLKSVKQGFLATMEEKGAKATETSGANAGKKAEADAVVTADSKTKEELAKAAELAEFDAEFEKDLGLTSK